MFEFIKPKSGADYFVALFSFTYLATKAFPMADGLDNMLIALSGLLCLLYFHINGRISIKKSAYKFGVFLCFFMILSILYNENARLENLLWVWAYLGVALCLYDFGISNFTATIICYGIELFFVYKVILNGQAEILAESVFQTGSNNNVSTVCLYATSIYYMTYVKNNNSLVYSYIPAVLVLFLSLYYANRGGMLASGVLLLGLLINNIRQEGLSKKNLIALAPAIIVIAYFFFKNFSTYGTAMQQKLERDGSESSRTIIWSEYFQACFDNVFHLLLGVPSSLREYPTYNYYGGNAHNAFIMLHAKFGLIPFVVVVRYIIKVGRYVLSCKLFVLYFVLISVSIRSLFDWTAFPGILDVVFWYFIIVNLNKSRNKHKI